MTRRLIISATLASWGLWSLLCVLSALPAQGAAPARSLAQPSQRPPIDFAATHAAETAAAQPPPPQPQPTTAPTNAPPTAALPTATATIARPRPTRTPTATATSTANSTSTPTPTPTSATAKFETATSLAATVEAIVAMTATALRLPSPAAVLQPTSVPPTAGVPTALPTSPPASVPATEAFTGLIWFVLLVPLVLLVIALLWLARRGFLLPMFYPEGGRPRWGALKPGRRSAHRRDLSE